MAFQNTSHDVGSSSAYNTIERMMEATVLGLICVSALVGNVSLWIVIISSKQLRSNSNALVLCLSTADLMVCTVNMPLAVYTIIHGSWPFGTSICKMMGFVTMVTFIASVMSLGTISINR